MTLEFTPAGFDAFQNNITDVSTVLVGTGTSTGTSSQRLQVTGGAYVSGNLGVGVTNPTSKLQVQGDALVAGILTVTDGIQGIGIQSAGFNISVGVITSLNFVGAGNSFSYNPGTKTVDINIGGSQWTFVEPNNPITSNIYRVNGNVGIGTTNPTSKLDLLGDAKFTGVITATTFNGQLNSAIGTVTTLNSTNANIATANIVTGVVTTISGTNLNYSGVGTVATLNSTTATITNLSGTNATYGTVNATTGNIVTGVVTTLSGTNATYTTGSFTNANVVTGVVTTISGTNLNYSGVGTVARLVSTAASFSQLQVAGISTFTNGPIFVGSGTSTGTASQRLQVTGGAYISGNLGIGTTRPTAPLEVQGTSKLNDTIVCNIQPTIVSYASSFRVATQETEPREVFFSNDGKTMYVLGNTGDDITWYTLSTPWDITTSTHVSQFSIASQLTVPTGFYFKPDGTKFYVTGTTGVGAAATSVNQYSCSTPWDLTTASYDSVAYSVIAQDTAPQGVEFKPDGTRMYIVGAANDSVYQYSLSTPWDLSTVSYGSSFSIASQETIPEGIRFSLDGTKLLLTGSAGDDINYYTLSTPWDITTTSFVGIITTVGAAPFNEITPSGLYWKPDGTRLYLSGYTNDTVWQFNMTSDADLEVTGKASVYGDLHIYEDTNVYGELSVSSIVGVGTTTSALKLKIQGDTNLTGRFNVSGSVGIGTTNPLGILQVGSASTTGAGTSMVLVTSTGSVGIGTTNPLGTLQVGAGTSVVVITSIGAVGIGTTNPQYKLQVQGSSAALDTRLHSVAEKTRRINGNTASLVYNTGSGNIAICTNPTGNITLNVTNIPTDTTFDNSVLTFSVIISQTGTARSCTAVNLNGYPATIRWFGGSIDSALVGVTTTIGYDIYSFTGINTVGSASTTANYAVLGTVVGGYR